MAAAAVAVAVLAGSWGVSRFTDLGSRFPAYQPAASTAAAGPGVGAGAVGGAEALPAGPAVGVLAGLAVKGRAPRTGYSRAVFGPAWFDEDANGCDTRNDILRRDLTAATTVAGNGGCVVAGGTLPDPYSGRSEQFLRGRGSSWDVQVDHVVALGNAWQTGAQAWTADRRRAYANDPLVLLAVDGRLNQQKGDGDAATWLPPNRGYRCAYVARQVAVKARYGLWVTPAERAAIAGILTSCPDQLLPTAADIAIPPATGRRAGVGADVGAAGSPTAPPGSTDPAVPAGTGSGSCGAPVNPYGYTYCPAGSPIYTPAAGCAPSSPASGTSPTAPATSSNARTGWSPCPAGTAGHVPPTAGRTTPSPTDPPPPAAGRLVKAVVAFSCPRCRGFCRARRPDADAGLLAAWVGHRFGFGGDDGHRRTQAGVVQDGR